MCEVTREPQSGRVPAAAQSDHRRQIPDWNSDSEGPLRAVIMVTIGRTHLHRETPALPSQDATAKASDKAISLNLKEKRRRLSATQKAGPAPADRRK